MKMRRGTKLRRIKSCAGERWRESKREQGRGRGRERHREKDLESILAGLIGVLFVTWKKRILLSSYGVRKQKNGIENILSEVWL